MSEHEQDTKEPTVRDREAEDSFVNDVNALYEPVANARFAIGQRTHEFVLAKGGTGYGKKIIDGLSKRPDLKPSRRSLYRYWSFYRIKSEFGDAIAAVAPNLTDSHYYELARLLVLEKEGDNTSADSLKDSILRLAELASVQRQSAEALGVVVTETIQKFGAAVVQAIRAESPTETEPDESAPRATSRPSDIARLLSYDPEGLQLVADYLSAFLTLNHLQHHADKAAAMARSFNVMGPAVVTLARFLADAGHADNIAPTVHRLVAELQGMDEQPEPNNQGN